MTARLFLLNKARLNDTVVNLLFTSSTDHFEDSFPIRVIGSQGHKVRHRMSFSYQPKGGKNPVTKLAHRLARLQVHLLIGVHGSLQ